MAEAESAIFMDLGKEREKELQQLADLLGIYSKDILSFKEAARYMGVSESFLYKLSSSRKISHSKPNNKLIFFRKEDLNNWLLQNPIRTANEAQKDIESYLSRNKK